jgi:hypothetical protein
MVRPRHRGGPVAACRRDEARDASGRGERLDLPEVAVGVDRDHVDAPVVRPRHDPGAVAPRATAGGLDGVRSTTVGAENDPPLSRWAMAIAPRRLRWTLRVAEL